MNLFKKEDKNQIIKVIWLDSTGSNPTTPWYLETDVKIWGRNLEEVHSVGYLIEDNKDYLILGMGRLMNKVLSPFKIPKKCILKIEKLS